MPRRVLITGITGFAGSHLAERLVERGDLVHGVAVVDPPFPFLERVADRVTVHHGDLTAADAIGRVLDAARPDLVYHLAGQPAPAIATEDPLPTIEANVIATGHVADAVGSRGIALVAASSADVYGVPTGATPLTEDAPVRPTNVYAATKVAAESVLRAAGSRARVTILRPSNQIGPRQHPRLAASEFAKRIAEAEAGLVEPVLRHGQLEPQREFIDVRDMAAAYERAAATLDGGTYNVGGDRVVPIGTILEVLLGLARVSIATELDEERVRAGVPAALRLDDSRFRSRTGWSPRIPLERSLADTLDFWREQVRAGAASRGG